MNAPPATLNNAQMQAVQHLHGPCLVLAGAGSGKTRVIIHKIARLLDSGLTAKQIAAITFTNKAAQEMRERAKDLVGPRAAKDLAISTFHSLGVRMLRESGEKVGLKPNFSILDSDDVLGVLRDAGSCTDNALARRWQWTISLWKNQGLDAAGAEGVAKDDHERVAARMMRLYEERLQAYQAVDFDDLIKLPLVLLHPRAVHGGGRRRPVHLRLARRHHREPQAPAAGLPAADRHPAGAELPQHRSHPARGQRGDRRQPQALREEAVERAG
jgi:ATP-dependent DNA helicase Rep